jgi:hypothetical protein
MSESIEYEVTLHISVPAGLEESAPRPFEDAFYASCVGEVTVEKAVRITPAVNYGGSR